MPLIEPPTFCPACSGELVWKKDMLYCLSNSCTAKLSKKVEHFAKVLKIKGLGPRTIEKLELESIYHLYTFTLQELQEKLGSVKLANNLYREIQRSKQAPLNILLAAFSIPLIGTSASEKLSNTCKDITDITEKSCLEAGLGPKATSNLLNWIEQEYLSESISSLPFSFTFVQSTKPLANKGVVCISGRLKSFKSKAEATRALENAGYTVKPSLTKDVTILVNESGIDSAKTKKATESGVKVINNIGEII